MADVKVLTRVAGDNGQIRDGLESDLLIIGGAKTVTAATTLALGTTGAGSDLTLDATGGIDIGAPAGGIALDAGANLILDYNEGAGAGVLQIRRNGATTVSEFSAAGAIAFTPVSGQHFSATTAGIGGLFLTTSGTGDFNATSGGTSYINAGVHLILDYNEGAGAGTFQVRRNGATTVSEFSAAGAIAFTPVSGQHFSATTAGIGGLFLTAGGTGDFNATSGGTSYINAGVNLILDYNEGAGTGDLLIRRNGATTIATFDQDGEIALTPISGQPFSVITAGTGYSLIDGVYYVNGGNASAFQTLLQTLQTAGTDAEIVLGAGTHDITWTVAQTLSRNWTIRGINSSKTIIRFVGTDADTRMVFTGCVQLEKILFQRSVQMTNQHDVIQLGASNSIIRDCIFEVDPQWASAPVINIAVAAEHCLIENVVFRAVFAKSAHISSAAPHTTIRSCKAIVTNAACDSLGSVTLGATAHYSIIEGCYFQSRDSGATATPRIAIQGDYCSINNTSVVAGETASSGHGVRCLTISGDFAHISNSSFQVLWPAATNCTDYLGDFSGIAVSVDNCSFEQVGFNYTNTSSSGTCGVLKFSGQRARIANNYIRAAYCKGGIWIADTGDYASLSNNFIAETAAYTSSYWVSAAIWVTAGAHYGTITGNVFLPSGSTSGYAIRGTANGGSSGWTITSNVAVLGNANYGIYVAYWTECNISGNTANSGKNFISGIGGGNYYGTGNSTVPGNNR